MMGKPPQFWALVAFFMVAGLVYTAVKPDGYAVHEQELTALFNLPDDVEFESFRSPYRRGGLQYIEGVVQLTPDQWAIYTSTLSNSSQWKPSGFSFRDHTVTANASADTVRWREHEYAWIKDDYASFWIGWGFGQSKEHNGLPSVGHAKAWKSLCWAVLGEGESQRVEACRDYKHTPKGLKFYVRAKLERENRRLFMYVR